MKYFMEFAYDGSNFVGYQKQNEGRTVQGELEKKLSIINGGGLVSIVAAGRTDAKVHAYGQCAHFLLDKAIKPEKLKMALNSLLDSDIHVKRIKIASQSFHARYSVTKKEYVYKINMGEYNPMERNYIFQYNRALDIIKMKEAIRLFEGQHSFESFTKTSSIQKDYVRTIFKTEIVKKNSILEIHFIGSGFLRYMVRNMVGFLIEIGEGKRQPDSVQSILALKDRTKAARTAPPEGLYLKKVFYS